jgi:hypothetical protein
MRARYQATVDRLTNLAVGSGPSAQQEAKLSPALAVNCGNYKQAVFALADTQRTDLHLHEANMAVSQRNLAQAWTRRELLGKVLAQHETAFAREQDRASANAKMKSPRNRGWQDGPTRPSNNKEHACRPLTPQPTTRPAPRKRWRQKTTAAAQEILTNQTNTAGATSTALSKLSSAISSFQSSLSSLTGLGKSVLAQTATLSDTSIGTASAKPRASSRQLQRVRQGAGHGQPGLVQQPVGRPHRRRHC